jgi:integrase/recombinase XerD
MALYLASEGLSWDAAIAEFNNYQRAANLAEKTIANREACYRHLANRSGKRPQEITLQDLQAHLGRPHPRTGARLAQGTLQSERSYLQTFYGWLRDEGYLHASPADRLHKIKMVRRAPRPLRMDQIEKMLDSGAYTRTRDIIIIAALTGLRVGEIVRLRGEDIDLEGMVVQSRRKGGLEHRIAVPPTLLPVLARYPRQGWLFPSPYPSKLFPNGGGHILMQSASDSISRALRKAGVTDRNITGHSLRHFCATWMLKQGVPIRVIQEHLGHASLATTQLYTQVDEDDMQQAVSVMPVIDARKQSARRGRLAA